MSKDVRESRSTGEGKLPAGCPFVATPSFDGNTLARVGWYVALRDTPAKQGTFCRRWEEVLCHIRENTTETGEVSA